MFKITPVQDKTRQKEICEICRVEFRPEALAYEMIDLDDGHLMGMAQFDIGEVGYIYDLKEAPDLSDFEAMFILGRQTMNFIDMCGTHNCKADKNGADEKLLHAIGFRKNDSGEYICNTEGMFNGHCDGHEVKL